MGKRGPAPQPTKLRLLNGARPDKVNQHEPIPTDELPVCPDDEPQDVRDLFDRVVRHLDTMKLASSADTEQLLVYCWAVVVHRQASVQLMAGDGVLIEGAMGGQVKHPALQIMRDAAQTIRSYAGEFGLTPSARAGLEVKGADDGDNPFGQPAAGG